MTVSFGFLDEKCIKMQISNIKFPTLRNLTLKKQNKQKMELKATKEASLKQKSEDLIMIRNEHLSAAFESAQERGAS